MNEKRLVIGLAVITFLSIAFGAFPTSPSDEDTYVNAMGTQYVYDETDNKWNIISGSGAVSDSAYSASWDSDTNHVPSKNAVYDKINAMGGEFELSLFRYASGADLSTSNTFAFCYFPAADSSCFMWWQKYYPSHAPELTDPTLVVIYTSPGGDTWTIETWATAEGVGEADNLKTLYDSGSAWVNPAGGVFRHKELPLSGTISPGDMVGVRLSKTTVDSNNFEVFGVFIKP